MTDAEKALLLDQVMEIVEDRIALETFYRSQDGGDIGIASVVRADGFGAIVNLLVGHQALPFLPISKLKA